MDSSPQMLLNVWREVSRHVLIDESVTRVMPLLSHRLPLDALLVRHVDLARTSLETVAAAVVRPGQASGGAKTECSREELDRILAWCREGHLVRAGNRPIQKQLPGLLPAELTGHFLVAPLNGSEGMLGALVLRARPSV